MNHVQLIGNLSKNPSYKNNRCVYRVITNTTTQTGHEIIEGHNIICYGNRAETAFKFLKKGNKVFVQGNLETKKWRNKEGNNKYSTNVICQEQIFLSQKNKKNLNSVMLAGNLTTSCKRSATRHGIIVCEFEIEIPYNDAKKRFKIFSHGKLGEYCLDKLEKNSFVHVEGTALKNPSGEFVIRCQKILDL
jgi:single-strand DNA-binding protein